MNATAVDVASALIASLEGCVLHAYRDPGGILTIGFGHTGADITPTLTWTQAQADAALARDQQPLFELVAGYPPLAQAALVSFGYNCGEGTLKRVLASVDLPDGDLMKVTMAQFCHDHAGNVLPSLARRRTLEQTLWTLATQKP